MSSDETIYTCAPPFIPTVQISGDGGRALLTIRPNGIVEGEIEDASEAARVFVESLRGQLRQPTPDAMRNTLIYLAETSDDKHVVRKCRAALQEQSK